MKLAALLSKTGLREADPLLALVVIWVLFALSAGSTFTSWSNQELMLLQTTIIKTTTVNAT